MLSAFRMREFRKRIGWTHGQLADACGVSRATILNWENHKTYPPLDKIAVLCQTFQCGLTDLIVLHDGGDSGKYEEGKRADCRA